MNRMNRLLAAATLCGLCASTLPSQRANDHGLMNHLEGAIKALRKLDRPEHAKKLLEWARELRRDLDRREKGQADPEHRHAGKKRLTEREQAGQKLETLIYCAKILHKADRDDASESLRRAAHILELRLKGKGEEARRVARRGPSMGATSRHLMMAAELLAKKGDREHAGFVAKMAKQMAARAERAREAEEEVAERHRRQRRREREEEEEEEEEEHDDDDDEIEEIAEHFEGRLNEMNKRLKRIERMLERLNARLERAIR